MSTKMADADWSVLLELCFAPRCRPWPIWCGYSTRPSHAPPSGTAGAKAASRSGARPLTWRLLHKNPPEDQFQRPPHHLRPDREQKERCFTFPDSPRTWPRYRSARPRRKQGLRQQDQREIQDACRSICLGQIRSRRLALRRQEQPLPHIPNVANSYVYGEYYGYYRF